MIHSVTVVYLGSRYHFPNVIDIKCDGDVMFIWNGTGANPMRFRARRGIELIFGEQA